MLYYNEFDPFAAEWLRELMKAGLIPHGEIDTRSITEVKPDDIRHYTQCHFFAGIGGWSEALRLAGWEPSRPVWTGSCPCQPFSSAGNQKGKSDERHLWPVWYNLIRECRPATIFGEQVSSAIAHGWLDDVYKGLEAEGYACGAAVLPACSVGKPHRRNRLFFVAHAEREGFSSRLIERTEPPAIFVAENCGEIIGRKEWGERNGEPELSIVVDGLPTIVGGSVGYGNAIVPQVAAEFIGAFMER